MSNAQRLIAGAAAVIVGLVGAGVLWLTVTSQPTPPQAPAAAAATKKPAPVPKAASRPTPQNKPAAPGAGGLPDRISGPVLAQSEPVGVAIPRLGVTSGLVHLGVDSAGAMEVPTDPADAGWYARGPTPGALGPAVIAGHVTWNQQPAVFYRLSELRRGDRVEVARADGQTAEFAVSEVARFAKSQFPTRAVYGAIDHAGLRLITCGGEYDDSANRYLDNVVVFATLVDVRPTKS